MRVYALIPAPPSVGAEDAISSFMVFEDRPELLRRRVWRSMPVSRAVGCGEGYTWGPTISIEMLSSRVKRALR